MLVAVTHHADIIPIHTMLGLKSRLRGQGRSHGNIAQYGVLPARGEEIQLGMQADVAHYLHVIDNLEMLQ